MADMEVQVIARAIGFEKLAADAERAAAAIKNMGAAARGGNVAGGAAAKQLSEDMRRVTNGLNIGSQIGADIRKGISKELSNGGFWNNMFTGLNSRFKAAGQNFGRSFRAGLDEATRGLRGMNGGHGPTHTQLMGGAAAGYGAFEFLKSVAESASAREQARLNLKAANIAKTPAQRAFIERFSDSMSGKYGNLSGTDGLNFLGKSLQIFGTADELFTDHGKGGSFTPEASAAMDRIFGLMSFMKTYEGGQHAGEAADLMGQFEASIRSSELKGLGMNPKDMADWVTKMVKTSIAYGVKPSDMLAAQRAGGAAFLMLDEKGMAIFSAMVQEQKQRAGVALATNASRLVSGVGQTQLSNDALLKYGIIDEADIKAHPEHYKFGRDENAPYGGILKVRDTSNYKDRDMIGSNPYLWAATDLYNGMRASILKEKGIDIGEVTTPLANRTQAQKTELLAAVGAAFGNRNAAMQNTEAIIQIANLMKRLNLLNNVDLNQDERSQSFLHQTQTFSDQMDQLKTNLGQSILPSLNDYLLDFNSAITAFSDATKEHPWMGTVAKYGALGFMGAGVISLAKLLFTHVLAVPFQLLKSIGWLALGTLDGLLGGGKSLFGGGLSKILGFGTGAAEGVAAGSLGALSGRVSKWLAASGTIGKVLGDVGKLMGILGRFFMWYQIADWAVHTDTGSTLYNQVAEALDQVMHPDKQSHGKKQLAALQRWKDDRELRDNPWLYPLTLITNPLDKPDYRTTLFGDRAKYFGYAQKHGRYSEYWQHLRQSYEPLPASYYFGWAPVNRGGGGPNMGGQKSGPVPVVITNQKASAPPNVTVGDVHITVQGNDNAAIAKAGGSALQSKIMGALSDQHH